MTTGCPFKQLDLSVLTKASDSLRGVFSNLLQRFCNDRLALGYRIGLCSSGRRETSLVFFANETHNRSGHNLKSCRTARTWPLLPSVTFLQFKKNPEMGLKSSKSGVLPGFLCCPSRLEEFCDTLEDGDQDNEEKRKELASLIENPIKPEVEPYIGKFFVLTERWDKEEGTRNFIKNVVKNNPCKPVLTRLFKSLLLKYGRDCISLDIDLCSEQQNQLIIECFVELFKAGFSCQKLLSGGGGCCWYLNPEGSVSAKYFPPYTLVACWSKFIQIFIQATHQMPVIVRIWNEVSQHLTYCCRVPSVHFKTQCQYALYCQGHEVAMDSDVFSQLLVQTDNPACQHMIVPKSLVNCCVGAIRRSFRGPNVYFALERMPVLPPTVRDQILLRHLFITE